MDEVALEHVPPPRVLQFSAVDRDSSVGKATHYGLDSSGIESRWGARFSAPMQTGPGAHPASCTVDTGCLSLGVKRPGRGVDHPPHLGKGKVYPITGHEGQRWSRGIAVLFL